MGKTRGVHETTPELRNRMVGMYEAGLGLREIAAAVNCSQRTVKRWLNRFDKEGNVETRERCGRKRATTAEQDEAIIRLATQTPLTAAKAVLPALGLTCSVDTVRERLHKAGIHSWTPSRKYMQRIPLGNDTDGAAIQQAVWRPTGTQLGKKKSNKDTNKNDKTIPKKKNPPRKVRARDIYVGDGAPVDNLKQSNEQQEFGFAQQNIPQEQTNEIQNATQALPDNQTEFNSGLTMNQQPQPMYQHPSMNIAQNNWPLDLVQGSHHYPQGQPTAVTHKPMAPQHQLQELHSQGEQHHMQQVQQQQQQQQQQIQQQTQQRLQEETNIHHSKFDSQQAQIQVDHQVQQQQEQSLQSKLSNPVNSSTNIASDSSNSCSSLESNQLSNTDSVQVDDTPKAESEHSERQKKKKKGGKAKGTLETSVEIRNRMIGMSEAGLSTLSIALAIDRSERTVKRWLERWHKEGNVQTKERKGRRRITTKEQDEAIVAMATQHPLTAAKYVAPALGLKCSVDTIRERLHKAGIHSWKLGKKQGEGNAVHTVHLWQPSGNRLNKPKTSGDKKKKSSDNKKRDHLTNNIQKRISRKKKIDSSPLKVVPPPANMVPEQAPMPFHNPATMPNYVGNSNILQPVHNISAPPPSIPQPQPPPPPGPPPGPQSMQPMGPIMQQRPDCRLAPSIVPPVSTQGNSGAVYASCLVANNNHTGHMEQPDPLNYEPYIWSF
ncbi:mediator of RNA polymerase II transcription subunit 15-like [Vespa mandarinia]|uniref:mediator of RNA polymerase II transcription subunit 15-like n=1 Tax=Vespa mandarinia TaxID=7446 RepID=UPI001616BBA0|nr:mediator of RNA polymerase II transcription subunit 15-like [Vespa mandarinia]XP_035736695.1 mediator of RNA polymerase II transcription subunit 15-like [Vespa mandarinia]